MYMIHEIEFAITTFCQARCRSCSRTDQDTGQPAKWLELKHMDFGIYKNVLQSNIAFNDLSHTTIRLCGEYGDPMMHPDIEKFMLYAADRNMNRLIIQTNGGLRHPAWYHKMTKYQNIRIVWGIDGTDHDTNWKYREGVDHQRAMDNMRTWFTNGGGGIWAFLLFEWNWHQIPEAIAIANEIGCTIEFKLNSREWGLLSPTNRTVTINLLKEYGYEV